MLGLGLGTSKSPAVFAFDPDALALFNAVGDVPSFAKNHINTLIVELKAGGVWAKLTRGIIAVPSLTSTNTLIDIKTLTVIATFANMGASPFNSRAEVGICDGYYFAQEAAALGYINTGYIPSSLVALNDSACSIGIVNNESASAPFNFGAFNGVTQSMVFCNKLNTNARVADSYGTTVGTGRISQAAADGNKGHYLINRTSNTYMELTRSGVVLGSIVGAQGTRPTVAFFLNTFNSSGVPQTRRTSVADLVTNKTRISHFIVYSNGLTTAERNAENTAFDNYMVNMQRIGNYTKLLVLDGNSHSVYFHGKVFRTIDYDLIGNNWKNINIGVSGQTTATMLANYAAKAGAIKTGTAGLSKYVYIAMETTNDFYTGGVSLATAQSNYQSLCQAAQADGYKVISVQCPCRTYVGAAGAPTETNWNLLIDDFNEWLDANWATFSDAKASLPSTMFIYRSNYATDADYNTAVAALLTANTLDGTHFTEAVYKTAGNNISTQVLTV